MQLRLFWLVMLLSALMGCDQLGIESPQKEAERKESEAKAIGSACRQAGRAIEDCYNLNSKAAKSAIFTGWREMDEYMRENKLEVVTPTVPPPLPKPKRPKREDTEEDVASEQPAKTEANPPAHADDKAASTAAAAP